MHLLYLLTFLYGIVIGSFLNVCIYRIPLGESIAKERSHCMTCGYQLRWYDLVPLFSWLALGGKCRKCKAPISPQYPIVEGVNGVLYVLIFAVNGFNLVSVLYCLMASALLALSVIDFRTYEIPFGFNVFIAILGGIRICTDLSNWTEYVIGFFAVSAVLELLLIISKGRAIGGGDVKLMAAAGLLLGWKLIILSFFIGCILGSVIHIIRMKVSHAEHVLAMGPYLSLGILIAALFGNSFITWYFGMLM
ncbi:MAG: prepilin peptidase [Lachnospiraceae bacterium]|nr:prepilin peptidase [Lachnospiraceae bacterium]